jgi:cytochrome d ubiquinol oxidase subunit II
MMGTWDVLRYIWFGLIGMLLAGYSVLDGFDLGIGTLLPFLGKTEEEKDRVIRAIGPFWDANEVWVLTGGGALFAAFPLAYATVFSAFYLPMMLVLFALIFRAVSLEFRAHQAKRKAFWEAAFVAGSFIPALLFGVALGNVIRGIPLDPRMDFSGNFFTLLNPFALLTGLLGLSLFLLQGATYAAMKLSGDVQDRSRKAAARAWLGVLILSAVLFVVSLIELPGIASKLSVWVFTALVLVSLIAARAAIAGKKDGIAFFHSSAAFVGIWGIAGSLLLPALVRARNNPALSLTVYNASSSLLTLKVMLIIAGVGMPIVIGYTIYLYRVFKGKVESGGYGY